MHTGFGALCYKLPIVFASAWRFSLVFVTLTHTDSPKVALHTMVQDRQNAGVVKQFELLAATVSLGGRTFLLQSYASANNL
ncbi:hypothetical protein EI94DRAFT_178761 [Lactarius quietus]|nr:hypothetical protein EI94DRAFT_178761 [Lactarius quietus]